MDQSDELRAQAAAKDIKHADKNRGNLLALEICFLGVVGLLVIAAFFEALTYKLVSSRTPFVIMVPLILLIAFQARRLFAVRHEADLSGHLKRAFAGGIPNFNKVLAKAGWMIALLAMIMVFGHIAGIAIYAFVLMWAVAKEKLVLALVVTACATLFIYVLFEIGFDVDLYRGLLLRYFQGYRDFG